MRGTYVTCPLRPSVTGTPGSVSNWGLSDASPVFLTGGRRFRKSRRGLGNVSPSMD